jgi:hypothetical protein
LFSSIGCLHTSKQTKSERPYIEHRALYEIEGWPQARQNLGIYSSEEVGRYLSFFISIWEERGLPGTREEIEKEFRKLRLHWQQTSFIDPENLDRRVPLLGLTLIRHYKNQITVFVYDGSQKLNPRIENTALGHELIHVALFATTRNAMRNHFDLPKAEWPIRCLDFQEEINDTFRRQRKR